MKLTKLIEERLPEKVVSLLRKIGKLSSQKGMTAYVVGGFVRDLLLGEPNLDIDIVVEGDGIAFAKELSKLWALDLTIHQRFLTATLHWNKLSELKFARIHHRKPKPSQAHIFKSPSSYMLKRLDIATARKERYLQPALLPEVEPATILEDLLRRDFSVNAMAICIAPDRFGELVDPTGGHKDLEIGMIRVLHEKSFVDDPTRIFRAVRYEQRFGFKIERKTMQLIRQAKEESLLTKLSRDRIKHELWRILQERNPAEPVKRLKELGIWAIVAPEIKVTKRRLMWLKRTSQWLFWFAENFPEKALEREWALLLTLLPNENSISSFCQSYQLSEREKESGFKLLKAMKRKTPKRPSSWICQLNPLPLESVLALAGMKADIEDLDWQRYLSCWRWVRPDVTGDDLKAHGIVGRPIAIGLQAALKAKVDKNASFEEQLKAALRKVRQFQGQKNKR
ncbi:MAG: hypothetical protein NZ805_12975 [Armatimonadetes bacterium]|nr:hypothetical protein [Armatimonadota bacterium]MDW8028627.1 hypothetical protein [Armatimonadota bacterium]